MNLIDAYGLTDAPVPINVYCKALGIEGYLLMPQDRDSVLKHMRLNVPSQGSVTIFTGPLGAAYWTGAPPEVRVKVVPGDEEIGIVRRCSGLEWCLRQAGVAPSEAKALAAKPPTNKHSQYWAYVKAQGALTAWDAMEPAPNYPEMEWIGAHKPLYQDTNTGLPFEVVVVDNAFAYRELGMALDQARIDGAKIGLDVETDQEEDYTATVVGAGFYFPPRASDTVPKETCYYLPLTGPTDSEPNRFPKQAGVELLRLHFAEREPPWFIGHGIKFDVQGLAMLLAPEDPLPILKSICKRIAGDGMIAAYCLAHTDWHTRRAEAKDLKYLTFKHFNVETFHFKEMLAISGSKQSSEAPLRDIAPYCCSDAFFGVKVLDRLLEELRETGKEKQLALYERLELPTIALVAEMEMLGLEVDYAQLLKRKNDSTKRVELLRKYLEREAVTYGYELTVETKTCGYPHPDYPYGDKKWQRNHSTKKADRERCTICDESGHVQFTVPFNANSNQQVAAVLQGTFALPRFNSTPGGEPSNDEASLLRLRQFTDNEDFKDWITFMLAWREENKLLGTYYVALWERKRQHHDYGNKGSALLLPKWWIHPTYNQAVVESGRFSAKDPNIQQQPGIVRDLYLGPWWNADYSQLELRIFARATGCKWMLDTFINGANGGDIHAATCAMVLGVRKEDQTPSIRIRGKTLNFGMAYGAAGETIEEQIIKFALANPELALALPSLAECKELVKLFWDRAPEAREWVQFIKELCRDRGYSETLFGRRRYLPDIRSNNDEYRSTAERQAVNHVIQGTAADIIKNAALMIWRDSESHPADLRTQVHDELMGRFYGTGGQEGEDWAKWAQVVVEDMELEQQLAPVPLVIHPVLVDNWKLAK